MIEPGLIQNSAAVGAAFRCQRSEKRRLGHLFQEEGAHTM